MSDNVHVYPVDDPKDHEITQECWCEPEVEFISDEGNTVWLHRRMQ